MILKSLTFQLKCLSNFSYPQKIDIANHNNFLWVLRESLIHGSSPLYARVGFCFVREPLIQRSMHAMQFSELKFLSKFLMKIRDCEEFDRLNDTDMLKQ